MMQLLPEPIAQMREEISTEIETAYKAAFGQLRDDLDALRRELRKLSGRPVE
jgi:polyhydroxyalkanoate synthesis regulator phasin